MNILQLFFLLIQALYQIRDRYLIGLSLFFRNSTEEAIACLDFSNIKIAPLPSENSVSEERQNLKLIFY